MPVPLRRKLRQKAFERFDYRGEVCGTQGSVPGKLLKKEEIEFGRARDRPARGPSADLLRLGCVIAFAGLHLQLFLGCVDLDAPELTVLDGVGGRVGNRVLTAHLVL